MKVLKDKERFILGRRGYKKKAKVLWQLQVTLVSL